MATMVATKAEDQFMDWLRDAHAAEEQAVTMLNKTAGRLLNYPDLRARIEQHAEQSRRQADLVRSCIERRGNSTSVLKEAGAKMVGLAQAAAGLFVSDEVMKAVIASAAFEEMEISSYKTLIAAAELLGDNETKQVCEEILHEEIEMRDWLEVHIPAITGKFLTREYQGETAKR